MSKEKSSELSNLTRKWHNESKYFYSCTISLAVYVLLHSAAVGGNFLASVQTDQFNFSEEQGFDATEQKRWHTQLMSLNLTLRYN